MRIALLVHGWALLSASASVSASSAAPAAPPMLPTAMAYAWFQPPPNLTVQRVTRLSMDWRVPLAPGNNSAVFYAVWCGLFPDDFSEMIDANSQWLLETHGQVMMGVIQLF